MKREFLACNMTLVETVSPLNRHCRRFHSMLAVCPGLISRLLYRKIASLLYLFTDNIYFSFVLKLFKIEF